MRFLFFILLFASLRVSFSQCETLHFAELGSEPAYCRTASYQSGNGVVYASAIGTGPCTYLWTNMQTGQTTNNTTWGGLNTGEYKIIATDSIGCVISEIVKLDSVNPHANFSVENIEADETEPLHNVATVTLKNLCDEWENGPIAFPEFDEPIYYWNLNQDTTWTPLYGWEDYVFEISSPGLYSVCISTQNKNGCVDTTCQTIQLEPFLFENEFANVTYSSTTGEVFIELLTAQPAILNITSISGALLYQFIVQPGTNSFQLDNGLYAFELITTDPLQLLCSGTIFIAH
jgi:hypothetical protein